VRNPASKTITVLATGVLACGASYLVADLSAVEAAPRPQPTPLPDVGILATPNTFLASSVPWWTANIQANEHIWATSIGPSGQGYVRPATADVGDFGSATSLRLVCASCRSEYARASFGDGDGVLGVRRVRPVCRA